MTRTTTAGLLALVLLVLLAAAALAQTAGTAVWEVVTLGRSGDITVGDVVIERDDTPEGWEWSNCAVEVSTPGSVVLDVGGAGCECDASCGVFLHGSWLRVGSFYDAAADTINFTADSTGVYALFSPLSSTADDAVLPDTGGAPAGGLSWLRLLLTAAAVTVVLAPLALRLAARRSG